MASKAYPDCGCFSEEKHGDNWKDSLSAEFDKAEFYKVEQGTGCPSCQVKRYTSEATRCKRCELIRAYLACVHRQPEQLLLFKEEEIRPNE